MKRHTRNVGDDIYMTDKLVSPSVYDMNSFQVGERVSVRECIGTYEYIPQYIIYSGIYKESRITHCLEHYIEIDGYDKSKWYTYHAVGKQKETVSSILLKKSLMSHPNMPLALGEYYSKEYGEHYMV